MDLKYKRHLNAIRPEKKEVNEHPSNLSGKDGDIVLFRDKNNFNKLEQFIKRKNHWINLRTGRPLKDTENIRRRIKIKTVKKKETSNY
tara:strand:+ start:2807 stop:3070 length:264 start_codon:yes stop_codon:yes gene_type:complete